MQRQLLYLYMRTQQMILKRMMPRAEEDRGASILEYAAVIVLVAGVAVALFQLEIFDNLVTTLETRVQELLDAM